MTDCSCSVCLARRFSRDVEGVCIRDPCPICMELVDPEASGDEEAFAWRCPTGVSHRLHLGCALDAIFRLGGCPTCRASSWVGSAEEGTLQEVFGRVEIPIEILGRLDGRRILHGLPRPQAAPIGFLDHDIHDLAVAGGVPLPPRGVGAPCCYVPDVRRRPDWAPLALRNAPHDPPYAWRPGWTCFHCSTGDASN